VNADLGTYLKDHWSSVEKRARALPIGDGTIRPTIAVTSIAARGGDTAPSLVLGDSLGEGGMGIVRLGRQGALDRDVAVKAVREERVSPEAIARLLQEAWVMGRLEHPNIVPIYDIAEGRGQNPLIVMKRIEGVPWLALMTDGDRVRQRFGAEDLLDWNLRVLLQVCNAVHFAHTRGIVHLDLKPSNVMIGAFGEVYLVDWGIAASIRADERRIPRTADITEIVGTPSYMAPEMLTAEGGRLGVHTDVYLLGAVLYEVLTGLPPHRGDSAIAIFYAAANYDPELPGAVPDEVAALCRAALRKEPRERPADAGGFRLGLQRFLDHRASARLADEAGRTLDALQAAIAAGRGPEPETFALGSAARFGFAQALATWPENEPAREGLRGTLRILAERALAMQDPRAARDLAAELSPRDEELDGRIEAAVRAEEIARGRRDQLERLGAQLDPKTGQRTRWFVLSLMGIFWTTFTPLAAWLLDEFPGPWYRLWTLPVLSLLLIGGLAVWARESLSKTKINRSTVKTIVVALVSGMALNVTGQLAGVATDRYVPMLMTLFASVSWMYVVTVERRTWPLALAYGVSGLGAALRPDLGKWLLTLANLVLVVNLGVIWWPEPGPVAFWRQRAAERRARG
jgi:serine/threonine-protein kinase